MFDKETTDEVFVILTCRQDRCRQLDVVYPMLDLCFNFLPALPTFKSIWAGKKIMLLWYSVFLECCACARFSVTLSRHWVIIGITFELFMLTHQWVWFNVKTTLMKIHTLIKNLRYVRYTQSLPSAYPSLIFCPSCQTRKFGRSFVSFLCMAFCSLCLQTVFKFEAFNS